MIEFQLQEDIVDLNCYCLLDLSEFEPTTTQKLVIAKILIAQDDPDSQIIPIELCPYCHTNDFLKYDMDMGIWCPNCDCELKEKDLEIVYC